MLYLANLTSIIVFVFGISFLVAEPWSKSEKKTYKVESKQSSKVSHNSH